MVSLELEARLDNLLSTAQAETADIDLFAPIQEKEECPICMIPLPIKEEEIRFMTCCGKKICDGCNYKHAVNHIKKMTTQATQGAPLEERKCAFCCQSRARWDSIKPLKKLVKKNKPYAFVQMAERYKSGDGVIQSYTRALEMIIRAAELGDANAFAIIAIHYQEGTVVEQNESKVLEYQEVAAKKGSIGANRNAQLMIKHLKIVASAGYKEAMDSLMDYYKNNELLTKAELAETLRAFQTSKNAMKSKDRDDARTARDDGLMTIPRTWERTS